MEPRNRRWLAILVVVLVLGMGLVTAVGRIAAVPLVLVLMLVASAGVDIIMRGAARYRPTLDRFLLPNLLIVAAALFLRLLPAGAVVVAGLAIFAGVFYLAVWAEHNDRHGGRDRRWSTLALLIVGYLVVFALYAAIYQMKTRTLFNAPAVVVATFLVAGRLLSLHHEDVPFQRLASYASFVALSVGQVTWALNYWPLNGLFGGVFLLTVCYFLVQVLSEHLSDRLTPRALSEHGLISLAAVALILWRGL